MQCTLVAGLLAIAATTAQADETPDLVTDYWPYRGFDSSLFVAADSGTRTGVGMSVGGAFHQGSTMGCGFVETDGAASLRYGPAPLGTTHRLHACVPTLRLDDHENGMVATLFPLEVTSVLELQSLPRLSMRRIVWSEPYTNEQVDVAMSLATIDSIEIRDELGVAIVAMPFTVHLDWLYQIADGTRLYETRHNFSAGLVGMDQPDGGSVVIFRGLFERDLWRIDLVDFDDFHVAGPLSFDLALGSGETLRYVNGELVRKGGFTGRFGLGLDLASVRASANVMREYYQTVEDAIVGDTRAEAEVRYTRSRFAAIVTAFRSKTTLIMTDGTGETTYTPTYGTQLDLDIPVTKRIDGKLSAAWARSFYAQLHAGPPSPSAGFEVNAQLVARLGRYRASGR